MINKEMQTISGMVIEMSYMFSGDTTIYIEQYTHKTWCGFGYSQARVMPGRWRKLCSTISTDPRLATSIAISPRIIPPDAEKFIDRILKPSVWDIRSVTTDVAPGLSSPSICNRAKNAPAAPPFHCACTMRYGKWSFSLDELGQLVR